MKKLKRFFTIFKKSLTSPKYYHDILKAKFSFSLKYLYTLLFFIALINALIFSVQVSVFIPFIPRFIETTKEIVRNTYPDELVVTIKDGKLSTNVKEPYTIPLPKEIPDFAGLSLVTFDTQAQVSDYPKYQSLALVTKDSVAFFDDNTNFNDKVVGYRVVSIAEADFARNVIIDKDLYLNFVNTLLPYLNYIKPLAYTVIILALLVFPFVAAAVGLIFKLFSVALAAVLLYLYTKVVKKNFPYKKLVQLGIHTATLTIVLNFLLRLVGIHLPGIIFLIIFLVFSGYIIHKIKEA